MFRCLADYHKFSGMYVLRHTCCVCVCVCVRACACVCVRVRVAGCANDVGTCVVQPTYVHASSNAVPREVPPACGESHGTECHRVAKLGHTHVEQVLPPHAQSACHDRTSRCRAVHSPQSLVLLSQRLVMISLQFLLALSLFMMFAASAAKSSASKNLPDFTLCNSMPDVAYSPWGAAPVRPVVAWRVTLVGVGGVLTTTACVLEPVCHVDAACAYIGC